MGEKPVQIPASRSFPRNEKSTALALKRGFLGGGPPVSESAPLALEAEPADFPLSILFGYFLSWESKYRPAGRSLHIPE